ncbi:MAG: molybdopterin molybdenumtransferase MoeA [Caulobacteraceae bacterium]|nr:molybdopterin molybdenumtransferase MoeA [Caulobacteraceae bacterium]
MKNLSIEDARAAMLAQVRPLGSESVPIEQAHGRVLAHPVDAVRDQPPFDASAMDGWAVRRADAAAGPVELDIAGESAAGRGYDGELAPGQAVRIFTGAAVPPGADTVVIQEDAEKLDGRVRLGPVQGGADNIRPRGGDFFAGDRLLDPGQRLDPWRLSLAAAAGRGTLSVARRPRVAILCTGEELVRPPREPGPWQIYESGSLALCALVDAWGGIAQRLAAARDEQAAVVQAVSGVDADLIVTVGGASVGDYDIVKPALGRMGLELFVQSVNIRPGKPTWFGRLGDERAVLGLPGNPASALVCAELFLRPLVRAMLGADPEPRFLRARLLTPLKANGPRAHLMRVLLDHADDGVLTVRPLADQDSSLVTVFARADGLLRRPAGAPAADAGAMVEVLRLERL